MANIIYLDNASTSKVNPEVLASYNQICEEYFANPSSTHVLGQQAHRLLEKSREQILKLFNLASHEVIFTSGATEANNLAIKGYALANKSRGNHIITSNTPAHHAMNCRDPGRRAQLAGDALDAASKRADYVVRVGAL